MTNQIVIIVFRVGIFLVSVNNRSQIDDFRVFDHVDIILQESDGTSYCTLLSNTVANDICSTSSVIDYRIVVEPVVGDGYVFCWTGNVAESVKPGPVKLRYGR